MSELDPLLMEIARLLAQAEDDDDPARLERTLTDGYARALWLEAERTRLERRLRQIAVTIGGNGDVETEELSSLVRRLELQAGTIEQLRDELGRLRQRHSDAVRAAAS